jgi:hypothetical protein
MKKGGKWAKKPLFKPGKQILNTLLDDFFAKLFLSAAKMQVLIQTAAGFDELESEQGEKHKREVRGEKREVRGVVRTASLE